MAASGLVVSWLANVSFPAEMLNALWNTVDKYPHQVAFRFVSSTPHVSHLFIIVCSPFFPQQGDCSVQSQRVP